MLSLKAKVLTAGAAVAALSASAMAYTPDYPLSASPDIFADVFNTIIVAVKPFAPALVGLLVLVILVGIASGFFAKIWGAIRGYR